MASVCYTWSNAIFTWNNAKLTWREFCILQGIITNRKAYSRTKNSFTNEEKDVLIKLILSMEDENSEIVKEISEKKNSNIIIDVDNVELDLTESNKITIKIDLNEL